MDCIKKAQLQLKNHKEIVETTELLPSILKQNKLEIYITEKALENMDEMERKVLQRTCIDDISPMDLQEEFGMSYRTIYKMKDAALKRFARMAYGVRLWEDDNNVD